MLKTKKNSSFKLIFGFWLKLQSFIRNEEEINSTFVKKKKENLIGNKRCQHFFVEDCIGY